MMIQNGIRQLLDNHKVIPVVTIENEEQIEPIIKKLAALKISVVEVTLRTNFALSAIQVLQNEYKGLITVGAGTVVSESQVASLHSIGVDFMVSPGSSYQLGNLMEASKIPFLPGAATPSEIIQCMERGWDTLKFFPADLFGGIKALKTYGQVFSSISFCPTGGIDESTYQDYLSLENVVSVGGSWMIK